MAMQAGIRPILATIPPWNCANKTQCALAESADPTPSRYQRIDQINAWIEQYGAEQGLKVIDYHSVLVGPDSEQYESDLTVDGVHPNPAGYAVMTPLAEAAITGSRWNRPPHQDFLSEVFEESRLFFACHECRDKLDVTTYSVWYLRFGRDDKG
jgi:hypothetical protein